MTTPNTPQQSKASATAEVGADEQAALRQHLLDSFLRDAKIIPRIRVIMVELVINQAERAYEALAIFTKSNVQSPAKKLVLLTTALLGRDVSNYELSRVTGLSAQTVDQFLRELETQGENPD